MRVSNLRLEHNVPFKYGKLQSRIICDLDANFTNVKEFWFSVEERNSNWLTPDVYDAFLVALLYPAMCYGEDIIVEGNVTKNIYHNLIHYVNGLVKVYEPSFHDIQIKVNGFAKAKKAEVLHVGTGFSGGGRFLFDIV